MQYKNIIDLIHIHINIIIDLEDKLDILIIFI